MSHSTNYEDFSGELDGLKGFNVDSVESFCLKRDENKVQQLLQLFSYKIKSNKNKTCFGMDNTLYCLKTKRIDILIVDNNIKLNVISIRNEVIK